MQRLLIVGASGHAKSVLEAVGASQAFEVIGLLDDRVPGDTVLHGARVLGPTALLETLAARENCDVLVAIGDNAVRWQLMTRIRQSVPTVRFATVVHPSAVVATPADIGEGTVVLAGAVIGPGTTIGPFVIVNTRAGIDHDCVLEAGVSIAPGVTMGGNCRIGSRTAVSIGAVVGHGRSIGEDTVIGAGAVVLRDIGDRVVAYGTPARPVRPRQFGDRYL
jgi:sugar O-acyltransferase (sialic acid O-acetyltransferase NeuD family)